VRDGNHRIEAARMRGDETIPAYVPQGHRVPGQRGSVRLFNDNDLNQGRDRDSFHGKIVERNPRSEYNANSRLAGGSRLTPEQQSVIDKLGGGKPLGARLGGGNQRGSVGVLSQRDAVTHSAAEDAEGAVIHRYTTPDKTGSLVANEYPERGVTQVSTSQMTNKGQGWGTRTLQRAADDAHARGQVLRSDAQVSHGQAGAYSNLKKLGYDVRMKPNDNRGGAYHAVGDHVFEVRPGKPKTASGEYEAPDELNTTSAPSAPEPYPPHPNATVKEPKRSAYPGIYDDPKDIVSRLETVPESPHLKDIFNTTRKQMHDDVIKQGDVPPKTPMPGMAPKGKGSAHASQITTPENAERIRNVITALKEHDPSAYHGMVAWYHSDPMYHSIVDILGGDVARASDVYHKLNTYTALASPMSSVGPEIRRGTAAATTAAEGTFDQFKKYGGLPANKMPKKATALKDLELGFEGHAFHGTAQVPTMSRFNETGEEAKAVKTGAYRRASDAPSRPGSEYQNTVPVGDSHFSRGSGLADVRGAAAYDSSIEGPELKVVHPWYHENVAKPLGIPATSAQAAQWAALSHETGVETPIGAPKLEIFADEIATAAKRAGVEPKEMWTRIIKRLAK
jgi:hypothetical protein